jgi:hypothetical protein
MDVSFGGGASPRSSAFSLVEKPTSERKTQRALQKARETESSALSDIQNNPGRQEFDTYDRAASEVKKREQEDMEAKEVAQQIAVDGARQDRAAVKQAIPKRTPWFKGFLGK